MLLMLASSNVDAQPRSVQGVPPAPGATGWGPDNCLYVFQQSRWQRQDVCRVMRGQAIYDTYRPSTRAWLARNDESTPGWLRSQALNAPDALWFAFQTTGAGRILVLVNGQWMELSQYMLLLQRTARGAPHMPAHCQAIRQGMSPGSIPSAAECRTPDEQKTADMVNQGFIGGSARAICQARQASQPYDAAGRVSQGWHDTILGPQRNACP